MDTNPAGTGTPKPINRNAKGLQAKARTHSVKLLDASTQRYEVTSGGSGKVYIVNVFLNGGASCQCDWAVKRVDALVENQGAVVCSHTIAVFEYIAQHGHKAVSLHTNRDTARAQHRPVVDVNDGVILTVRKLHYKQLDFFKRVKGKGK